MPELDGDREWELLLALKSSSHHAFEQFYHQYKQQIYHNLHRLVHQREVAEELTHDVFLKVWQLRETIDENKSFGAFLRRIASNLAIDFYRRAALDKRMQEALIHAATEYYDPLGEESAQKSNHALIQSILEKLPPRRREVFVLCKLEGKRYAEVAKTFGIGIGTVNDHIVKATKFIRAELAKHPERIFLLMLFSEILS